MQALGPKGGQSNALARIRALPLFAWHPLSASLAALVLAPASYLYIRQRKATQPKQTRYEPQASSSSCRASPSIWHFLTGRCVRLRLCVWWFRSELAWSHAALTGPSAALLSYGVYAIYRNKSNNK